MIIRTQFVHHTAHIITTNDDSSVSGRVQWRKFAKLTSCHLTKTMYEGYCVTYVAMMSYWSTYNDSHTAACDIVLVAPTCSCHKVNVIYIVQQATVCFGKIKWLVPLKRDIHSMLGGMSG